MSVDRPTLCRISAQKAFGPRGHVLRIGASMPFLPGQVLGLALSPEDSPRWYSIASAPGEDFMEVFYTVVDEGALTPTLSRLDHADALWVWPPRGQFIDSFGSLPTWWIANGTGVAPFASMFRAGLGKGRFLIQGARSMEEAWNHGEFSVPREGFSHLLCLSSPEEPVHQADHVRHGRLTTWLSTELPRHLGPQDRFMLCGAAGMIVDVREILTGLGVPHEHIVSEIYF